MYNEQILYHRATSHSLLNTNSKQKKMIYFITVNFMDEESDLLFYKYVREILSTNMNVIFLLFRTYYTCIQVRYNI